MQSFRSPPPPRVLPHNPWANAALMQAALYANEQRRKALIAAAANVEPPTADSTLITADSTAYTADQT